MTELVGRVMLNIQDGSLTARGPAVGELREGDVNAIEVQGEAPDELLADGDVVRADFPHPVPMRLEDRAGYVVAVLGGGKKD